MLKRLFFAFVFFLTAVYSSAAYSPVNSAIVVNAKTSEVVYSYNADQKTQPASLTKMMTLLLAFKALRQKKILPTTLIRISANAASQKPCTLGLRSGETISVHNAIIALIVKSANDIAVALAEHLGGTEKSFVSMMNIEAKRLGMSSTIFFNPSGWKNPQQLTTAKDIIKLSKALIIEYPEYYHAFATKQFFFGGKCIKNHNKLLGRKESITVDGIKTGFLNASGFNIAVSAVKGKTRLIAVVMGGKTCRQRDFQAELLIKKGFARLQNSEIYKKSKKAYDKRRQKTIIDRIQVSPVIYNKIGEPVKSKGIDNEPNKINPVR